jgi:F0F1-type ATP synthase assembly protein I
MPMPDEIIDTKADNKSSQKKDQEPKNIAWWQPAIMIFLKFSVWIFVPVLAALFIGKWLDKRFGTDPWLFLGLIAFAFAISMFGIIKGTSEEYKKIEGEEKDKSSNKNDEK